MSSNAKALTMEEEEELEKHRTTAQNNKRCTNCNGTLVFDPNTQMMKCEYCEAVFEIPRELDDNEKAAEANAKDSAKAGAAGQTPTDKQQKPAHKARNRKGERPLEEATEDNKEACDWGSKKKMITCKTCGAQTIYDAVQTISACPYCDSNQVMEKNDDQNGLAPTGICVFKVDRAKAREQFHDWVNGLWFAPNKLKKVANADSIEGLYLPHWTYDTQVRATYTGEYGVEDDDDNVTWYNCSGKIEHFFDDFLIPACKKENNHILEDLEPFNTNDYEDYKPEYMVGYAAERYSVTVHEGWKTAQERIKRELEDMAEDDIKKQHRNADRARTKKVTAEYSDIMYKYLMLPIWISSYRYNGKVYQFMVNGQTGKVAGDRPYSMWKIAFAIAIFLIICYFFFGEGEG